MTIPYLHGTQTKLLLQVRKDLDRHEGYREFAYPDPLSELARKQRSSEWGFKPARQIVQQGTDLSTGRPWTVGYGFTSGVNPDSRMGKQTAERKLDELILDLEAALHNVLIMWHEATFITKTVLINMAFNMGIAGLLSFKNTINYIKQKEYEKAGSNLRKSLYYRQVTTRAEELARRLETQHIPAEYKAAERI